MITNGKIIKYQKELLSHPRIGFITVGIGATGDYWITAYRNVDKDDALICMLWGETLGQAWEKLYCEIIGVEYHSSVVSALTNTGCEIDLLFKSPSIVTGFGRNDAR